VLKGLEGYSSSRGQCTGALFLLSTSGFQLVASYEATLAKQFARFKCDRTYLVLDKEANHKAGCYKQQKEAKSSVGGLLGGIASKNDSRVD
jgi:hypothetical protein